MRLIDADELTPRMQELASSYSAIRMISNAPTIDAAQVVHGEWIKRETIIGVVYLCSICSSNTRRSDNYCHNCGASMS